MCQVTPLCYPLLHWQQGAGSEVSPARLLHRADGVFVEGQVRERGEEDPRGRGDPPGQAAGGDRRALHVPQHPGQQAAATYQGLPH